MTFLSQWYANMCVLVAPLLIVAGAAAQPVATNGSVTAGRPPVELAVHLEHTETEVILTFRGRGAAHRFQVPGTTETTFRSVVVGRAPETHVGVIEVTGPTVRLAVLVSHTRAAPRILWSGRLDLQGDRGERTADRLEIGDRTNDGIDDIVVGTIDERIHVCGEEWTLLAPRAVHAESLSLRSVELRPFTARSIDVAASTTSPGPEGLPAVNALRFDAASSALTDRDPATSWTARARWSFATGRWFFAGWPFRAMAIRRVDRERETAEVWLVGDAPPALRVLLPAGSGPFWIVPPEPIDWRCMSIVSGNRGALSLAEVAAYTDLDFGGGIEMLVRELGGGGGRAAQLDDVLVALGEPAIAAVLARWQDLSPLGRRRAVRAFVRTPAFPPSQQGLSRALTDSDIDVQNDAFEAAARSPDVFLEVLEPLVARPDSVGDRAADIVARTADPRGLECLLAAIAGNGGDLRPALRRALDHRVIQAGSDGFGRIAEWAQTNPSVAACAAVALALSEHPGQPVLQTLIRSCWPTAERFEDRYRLVQAATSITVDQEIDGWLSRLTTDASAPWMLRAEALSSLAGHNPIAAVQSALEALGDPYPRVRLRAIEILSNHDGPFGPVVELARGDPWPLVRALALGATSQEDGGLERGRQALSDRSRVVRTAGVEVLTALRDAPSAVLVEERLRDENEWPDVIEVALGYVRTLCVQSSRDAVEALVLRGLRPAAWAPDVDISVLAIDALGHLGAQSSRAVLDRATAPLAPRGLRAAALRAMDARARCGR